MMSPAITIAVGDNSLRVEAVHGELHQPDERLTHHVSFLSYAEQSLE